MKGRQFFSARSAGVSVIRPRGSSPRPRSAGVSFPPARPAPGNGPFVYFPTNPEHDGIEKNDGMKRRRQDRLVARLSSLSSSECCTAWAAEPLACIDVVVHR